jgi:hypothetical protein
MNVGAGYRYVESGALMNVQISWRTRKITSKTGKMHFLVGLESLKDK